MSTAIEKATDEINKALEECSTAAIQALPQITKAFKLASGIRTMRLALNDQVVETMFMPLQGSPLGFRTDQDTKGGYPVQVVRECVIEALIRGFQVVGNEFNIIANRAYFTKEGFDRKVSEFPGLTNLAFSPGVPKMVDGGALVPYRANFLLNGKAIEIVRDLVLDEKGEKPIRDERIPVRVNAGAGADNILGKAKRKILAQIYERISGAQIPDGDVIDTTGVTVESPRTAVAEKTDELIEKHKAKVAAKKNGNTAAEPPADPAAGPDGAPEPGANG